MKKIISFSVWGNEDKYILGALENLKISKDIYPGWICRFYCDKNVNSDFINLILKHDGEIVIKEIDQSSWEGLFWRFLPASENDVEIFISRDIDSRLNEREKAAVDEWVSSDKGLHSMRDHVEHNVPILGGMWGAKNGAIESINSKIENWVTKSVKGSDQDFLSAIIWNDYRQKFIVHDRFCSGLSIMNNGEFKMGYIHNNEDGKATYIYDPIKFFGNHDLRPFPKHEKMNYGCHVGEIIE